MADIAKCARAVEKRKIVTLAACISKMAVMILITKLIWLVESLSWPAVLREICFK